MTGSGVNLHSGDPFHVHITYDGANLAMTITDTTTNGSFSYTWPISLPSTFEGNYAYVGFTGGTGGLTAIQDIQTWTFTSGVTSAPTITSLSPTSGPVGTSVTITGTNFGSTQGTSSVKFFNGVAATPTSWTATTITAPVPSSATTGNVVVTVGGVASNGVSFTVTTPAPTITSLSPTSGPVGTSVTITGTNFGSTQGTSSVKFFNGVAATPTSWTATTITAPVPSSATTGNVVVTVGGVASNGVSFTVTTPAPTITSLSPTSGPVGTPVTITGIELWILKEQSDIQRHPGHDHELEGDEHCDICSLRCHDRKRSGDGGRSGQQWRGFTVTASGPITINYGSGFTPGGMILLGSAKLNGTALQLTDGGTNEAAAAWYGMQANIQSFTTDFTFLISAGTNPTADGFTFTMQGDSSSDIGIWVAA